MRSRSTTTPLLLMLMLLSLSIRHRMAFSPPQKLLQRQYRSHVVVLHNHKKKQPVPLSQLAQSIAAKPAQYIRPTEKKKTTKKSRSRSRASNPQQTYRYKRHTTTGQNKHHNRTTTTTGAAPFQQPHPFIVAKTDADPIPGQSPVLLDALLLFDADADETGNDTLHYAYFVAKPVGWAILGAKQQRKTHPVVPPVLSPPQKTPDKHPPVEEIETTTTTQQQQDTILDFDESDLLAVMTADELEDYRAERRQEEGNNKLPVNNTTRRPTQHTVSHDSTAQKGAVAVRRPSVIAWLKDYLQTTQNKTVRGGTYWTAIAGATAVDDSGVVLLVPKPYRKDIFCEAAVYHAVAGTDGRLASGGSSTKKTMLQPPPSVSILSKLKKGRQGRDIIQNVQVSVEEQVSTNSDVAGIVQEQLQQGIRGDAHAEGWDRRAARRLIHCHSLSVSSLHADAHVQASTDLFRSDLAVFANRRTADFQHGSYLGRDGLRALNETNMYREINSEGDGFPGWTVDRYDKWLLVTHNPNFPRGPLPSIHDGNTGGVYYIQSNVDRQKSRLPVLLEGTAAPDVVPVLENGVRYLVSLHQNLSTGIFLDQRPQRAWLTQNCNNETRVLNCFAHTGGFSVAAATAGASTVSLDLSRKWLDRLPEQLEANGIEFDEKHDCIYGDCFDWLVRLGKREEKFDIVIVDPPSSSVGKKKKRWSVTRDMDELASLAVKLVKPGGLLWTTTNCASLSVSKFARSVDRGIEEAGVSAKLERIQPMPVDFPSIGPQPVKNLVWRIQ